MFRTWGGMRIKPCVQNGFLEKYPAPNLSPGNTKAVKRSFTDTKIRRRFGAA
jgi:hypothetical protein